MRTLGRAFASAFAVLLAACRGNAAGDLPDAPASPQAHAEPAPIANAMPTDSANALRDGGPPPSPMRGDQELAVDTPKETQKEAAREPWRDGGALTNKEPTALAGWSMQAVLRPSDVAGPPKAPEVATAAIDTARKKTEARLAIDFSQTRARIVFNSAGFVVPEGSELRARVDRYGYVLLLGGEDTYRIAEAGALRALLGERRLDVAPLSAAEIASEGSGATRLNLPTRKVEVTTRAAKATFEIATLKDSGDGGGLICRAILDLMNAPPSTPLCGTDQVPLFAELRWTTKGAIAFEALSLTRRADLTVAQLAAPPATVTFVPTPPAVPASDVLLSRVDLASFRSAPVEAVVAPAGTSPDAAPGRPAPTSFELVNSSDELRFVTLDGVPVAWLAPGGRDSLPALVHGRYVLQWRTFLGDSFETAQIVTVPGLSEMGGVDAGAN